MAERAGWKPDWATMVRNPYLILIGAPGSGKSWWARHHFKPREIVSSDTLRGLIGDHEGDQRATPYAFDALHAIIAGRVQLGQTTVVDATNSHRKHRDKLISHGTGWMRPPIAVIFDVPLDVCLERNAGRPARRRVPEDVVRDMHVRIAEEFPAATTWFPSGFGGGLWVRYDGPDLIGGGTLYRKYKDASWLDGARKEPPSYWSEGKYGRFHTAGWDRPRAV